MGRNSTLMTEGYAGSVVKVISIVVMITMIALITDADSGVEWTMIRR